MPPEDFVRIRHMIEACESALRFSAGRQRQDFDDDSMLLFAVVRAIEIVGEAASKISMETRNANPQVPWTQITGMRNRLVHAYFDVNINVVWKTVSSDIPALLPLLQALIPTTQD